MKYTYEVINVDKDSRCMEVRYTHEQHGPVNVGVRIPTVGENVEQVIKKFAPIGIWQDKEQTLAEVDETLSGEINLLTSSETRVSLDHRNVYDVVEAVYKDIPKARIWAVENLEAVELKNAYLKRYYAMNGNLIGVEVFGPQFKGETDPYAGYLFFLSVKTIVKKARELGVPIFAATKVENLVLFAKNDIHVSQADVNGYDTVVYVAWDDAMIAARENSLAIEMRNIRNKLLTETDWIHLPDTPKLANVSEWETYRQALRDITGQETFPTTINWPTKPL